MKPSLQTRVHSPQTSESELLTDDIDPVQARSFVLKLWIEGIETKSGQVSWRGHITQVISRTGQYVKSLDEINSYLIQQLQDMRVENINLADNSSTVKT
jgi:hypothetical protein